MHIYAHKYAYIYIFVCYSKGVRKIYKEIVCVNFKMVDINTFQERGGKQTSVYLPHDTWVLAKTNMIEFKKAMVFGIKFLIAEKSGLLDDYPACNLVEKVKTMTLRITTLQAQINKLNSGNPATDPKKEADEFFENLTTNCDPINAKEESQ